MVKKKIAPVVNFHDQARSNRRKTFGFCCYAHKPLRHIRRVVLREFQDNLGISHLVTITAKASVAVEFLLILPKYCRKLLLTIVCFWLLFLTVLSGLLLELICFLYLRFFSVVIWYHSQFHSFFIYSVKVVVLLPQFIFNFLFFKFYSYFTFVFYCLL